MQYYYFFQEELSDNAESILILLGSRDYLRSLETILDALLGEKTKFEIDKTCVVEELINNKQMILENGKNFVEPFLKQLYKCNPRSAQTSSSSDSSD